MTRIRPLTPCTFLIAASVLTFAACSKKIESADHAPTLQRLVTAAPEWTDKTPLGKRLWQIERDFYAARQYLPAWVDGVGTTPQMKDLVQQLLYSEKHGLDPEAYGVKYFEAARAQSQTKYQGTQFDPAVVPELDARMTYAYLRYAADLLAWGARPRDVYVNWLVDPKKEDLAARLAAAVKDGSVRQSLEELAPDHPQYRGLQAALVREQSNPTGRADQLKMNLERWRWAPRTLGDEYVLINVPAYQMQVMKGDTPALAMRVIVGQPETPTPLFSDEMTYVVFSPYWNIPESILREETLPRIASDRDYLKRNNLEVVGTSGTVDPDSVDWSDESAIKGLRLRQAPGPENALGLVKFIFPNHFSVYLHDTPGDRLFFKDQRALSHGCIRIEKPVAMAEYVLGEQGWAGPRIVDAMNAKSEQTVTLKRKLPVHIGYWTAWVDSNGAVIFTDDPYRIDEAHLRLWKGRPRPVTGAPQGA